MISIKAIVLMLAGLLLQQVNLSLRSGGSMDATAVMVISGAVVLLTQMVKWAGLPDRRGPLAVMVISLLGVAFWGWSRGDVSRATAFDYFAGWVVVAASSAGVFGFTRAMPAAVTATSQPPAGAGSNPTG